MTRLAYRTALASLLTVLAAALARLMARDHALAPLLGAVVLGYLGAVALVYALGAAWHSGTTATARRSQQRRMRDLPPSRRPAPGTASRPVAPDPVTLARDAAIIREYAGTGTEGRHAAREAALPRTLPMPVLGDTVRMSTVGGP